MSERLRLLLVEDDADDAALVVRELRRAGWEPEVTLAGDEAAFLAGLAQAPELILCDYSLPQFGAPRALELLRQRGVEIPILIVSGTIGEETAVEAMRAGAWDYLLKDRLARLGVAVEHALAQSRLRSERRQAEQALRDSEARHRQLIDLSPEAILVNRGGVITLANPAAQALFGARDAGQLLGRSPLDFFVSIDHDRIRERIERVLQGETVPQLLTRITGLDGTVHDVEAIAAPIDEPSGRAVQVLLRDVTHHHRALAELAESEARLRSYIEHAPLAVFVADRTGRYVEVNRGAVELTGYSAEELLQLGVADLLLEEDRAHGLQRFAEVASRGFAEAEVRLRRRDGGACTVNVRAVRIGEGRLLGFCLDITERRRAEQALRESEQRFRAMADSSPAIIWVTDAQGGNQFVNRTYRDFFGVAGEDVEGGKWQPLIHPDDASAYLASFQQAVRARHSFAGMVRVRRPNGEWAWLSSVGEPRFSATGEFLGHTGISLDVTERRRAEEALRTTDRALREGEARYRLIFDNSPLPKWLYDVETLRFLEVNQAALRSYGYSREEFLALTLADIRPPAAVTALREAVANAKEVEPAVGTWRHRKKDGTELDVEISGQAIEYGGHRSRMVVAQDVTERRRAEEALRASEEKFRQLAETIREVFWVTNVEKSNLIYVSPGYEAIWGRTVASLLAEPRSWLQAIHPDDRERVQHASLTRQADGSYDEVYRIIRPDGSLRWIRDRAFPVRTGGAVERVVGIAEDITALRQAEAQLRQAQKLEGVGQLAGGIAHDFNNLLTVILSACDELGEQLGPVDPRRAPLGELLHAAERAASLTRQLLVFSRREVIEPKVVDLNEVVAGVGKMLQRLIGEDIELACVLPRGPRTVRADPGHLEQVLINLAVNARDAMPKGGKLTIETSEEALDAARCGALPGSRPGRWVRLSVTDTGCGMTPEVQARIFEPFFTTKEVGRGTGLGLATVFGIVTLSGGFIEVRSEPDRGSAFSVWLPAHAAAPARATRPAPAKRPGREGSERVLLVEDDAVVRRIALRALTGRGYQVVEAPDGARALAAAQGLEGAIDLVLTDVVLPAMSGPELVGRLREGRPALKVLYMSGYTDDAVVRHGIMSTGAPFLHKPFTPLGLAAKVREVLDGTQ